MDGVKRAVVVGVNEYEDSKITPLKGAVNDATEVCQILKESGGFEVAADHFLTDRTDIKPTCEKIRKAASDLLWKTDPCDVSLFYFSGHGLQDSFQFGYIAPCDIDREAPLVKGIRIQELKDLFLVARSETKNKIILVLDCCHSGTATQESKEVSGPKARLYEAFSGPEAAGAGKFILASSGRDQESREITRRHAIRDEREVEHCHGLFTFHLLEGLNGAAADESGLVRLGQLRKYVGDRMESFQGNEINFWGFGSGRAEDVVISKASKKLQVERWVEEAEKLFNTGKLPQLATSITTLGNAIRCWPEVPHGAELKEKINKKLQELSTMGGFWASANRIDLEGVSPREYSKLEAIVVGLSFDRIVELDRTSCGLVIAFLEAASGQIGFEHFRLLLTCAEVGPPTVEPSKGSTGGQGSA